MVYILYSFEIYTEREYVTGRLVDPIWCAMGATGNLSLSTLILTGGVPDPLDTLAIIWNRPIAECVYDSFWN